MPALRKTQTTQNGLRFHRRKGSRNRRANTTEPWQRRKVLGSLPPGAATPGPVERSRPLHLFSTPALSSPLHNTRTNSRLPPLTPQHPIAGRAQTTNHSPRPKPSNQSWIEVRGRALWHPMKASAVRTDPRSSATPEGKRQKREALRGIPVRGKYSVCSVVLF